MVRTRSCDRVILGTARAVTPRKNQTDPHPLEGCRIPARLAKGMLVNLLRRCATAALVAPLLTGLALSSAHAVTISWVTVGDPGNTADTTTYGDVAAEFRIMEFE